ncbi:helix-turn-helix domain-containing protein [Hyphococcus sp. DH-69]|uniref:helix-turn-helix domain-containing protein n=1 Tax=Hyphococcus formosus TaxID=3143534 RepID=UPI00398B7CD5
MACPAMGRRLNGRSISIHRCYTVSETATALGLHRGSVLRWLSKGELSPIDQSKPFLIHGKALREFIDRRTPRKQKCALHEWFCFRCRAPRTAAFGEAEIIGANVNSCNIRALCSDCAAVVHKRFSLKTLATLRRIIRLSAPQHLKHLIE